MRHSVCLNWVLLISFVRSEVDNSFSESLKEVRTTLNGFITQEDRDQFNQVFNLVTDYSQGSTFEEVCIKTLLNFTRTFSLVLL